jgi:hypothetical protein
LNHKFAGRFPLVSWPTISNGFIVFPLNDGPDQTTAIDVLIFIVLGKSNVHGRSPQNSGDSYGLSQSAVWEDKFENSFANHGYQYP